MTISTDTVIGAALAIADVDGVEADAHAVIEDAFLLAYAFADEEDYLAAVANTRRALRQLCDGAVSPSQLKYDYKGWCSYHFQHRVAQGARADMRIIFKRTSTGVRLRAFGHRNLPKDFYERVREER